MATVIPLNHQIVDDRTGNHFEINKVNHDGSSTTIEVAGGLVSAAALLGATSGNVPTVAVTQGNDQATAVSGGTQSSILLTGGDSGEVYVVSRHRGNAAGL